MASVVIGVAAGLICYGAVLLKSRLGYDDSLDTFGVHGVGGTVGALLTGAFVTTLVNTADPVKAAVERGPIAQMGIQAIGVAATVGYAVVATWILLKVIDAFFGLRIRKDEEELGLDLSQHGEAAYNLYA
jgi:Amt family ammonium transporter